MSRKLTVIQLTAEQKAIIAKGIAGIFFDTFQANSISRQQSTAEAGVLGDSPASKVDC